MVHSSPTLYIVWKRVRAGLIPREVQGRSQLHILMKMRGGSIKPGDVRSEILERTSIPVPGAISKFVLTRGIVK